MVGATSSFISAAAQGHFLPQLMRRWHPNRAVANRFERSFHACFLCCIIRKNQLLCFSLLPFSLTQVANMTSTMGVSHVCALILVIENRPRKDRQLHLSSGHFVNRIFDHRSFDFDWFPSLFHSFHGHGNKPVAHFSDLTNQWAIQTEVSPNDMFREEKISTKNFQAIWQISHSSSSSNSV